jgi:hypothetical protein
MVSWNPAAIPGLVVAPLVVGMAAVVYWARPERAQNRYLAGFLLLVGLGMFFGHTLRFLVDSPEASYAAYICYAVALLGTETFHLLFVGTLNVPWLVFLRTTGGRATVVGVTTALVAVATVRPSLIAQNVAKAARLDVYVGQGLGPLWYFFLLATMVTSIIGIVASLQSARRARMGLERSKGRALARAYIAYDAIMMPFFLWAFLYIPGSDPAQMGLVPAIVNFYTFMFAAVVLCAGLALGILRSQLFDIDVKIRWTVKRGTLAGIFIATFFVVSQLIQNFTTEAMGTIGGAVAAGLLLFAITPLQAFAERLSRTAVPAKDPKALEERKLEIYKAALEGAWQDGRLSGRERTVLTRLQLELGIANAESRRLQIQVRKSLGT